MNFYFRQKPIWDLAIGVFIILALFSVNLLDLKGWKGNFSHLGWLAIDIAVCLIVVLGGYLWFPTGIITIRKEEKEGDDNLNIKNLILTLDGKERRLKKNTLPQQVKVFFGKRGEYRVYCRAEVEIDGKRSEKVSQNDLNLYDPVIAHTEIVI
ncbi:MAG: hypothetical protein HQ551_07065 [Desulfobacteraceae bacterium]|nr:hypothetical protein [Desulfobacteraceae bacterium]